MVKSFRVSDLQTLLASMGRSKSGLKQDLVARALRLVQTEYSPELLKNVRQLYETRFPKAPGWLAARRPEGIPAVSYPAINSSPRSTAQGTDYLNGMPKLAAPPAAEVKLVPLPFYHNLETLLPPTELSMFVMFDFVIKLVSIVCILIIENLKANGYFSSLFHASQLHRIVRNYRIVSAFLN